MFDQFYTILNIINFNNKKIVRSVQNKFPNKAYIIILHTQYRHLRVYFLHTKLLSQAYFQIFNHEIEFFINITCNILFMRNAFLRQSLYKIHCFFQGYCIIRCRHIWSQSLISYVCLFIQRNKVTTDANHRYIF